MAALETLRARQDERLRQMLRYAAAHSPYYERVFREQRFDPSISSCRRSRRCLSSPRRSFAARQMRFYRVNLHAARSGSTKTGGSTGVALTTYFDRDWLETRTADSLRSDQWRDASRN